MKQLATIVAILTLFACTTNRVGKPQYLGDWVITSFVSAPISAMSHEEAVAWVGRRLELTQAYATFNGRQFSDPLYSMSETESEHLLDGWPQGLEAVGFDREALTSITVCKETAPASRLWQAADCRMLMHWDGVWFVLEAA